MNFYLKCIPILFFMLVSLSLKGQNGVSWKGWKDFSWTHGYELGSIIELENGLPSSPIVMIKDYRYIIANGRILEHERSQVSPTTFNRTKVFSSKVNSEKERISSNLKLELRKIKNVSLVLNDAEVIRFKRGYGSVLDVIQSLTLSQLERLEEKLKISKGKLYMIIEVLAYKDAELKITSRSKFDSGLTSGVKGFLGLRALGIYNSDSTSMTFKYTNSPQYVKYRAVKLKPFRKKIHSRIAELSEHASTSIPCFRDTLLERFYRDSVYRADSPITNRDLYGSPNWKGYKPYTVDVDDDDNYEIIMKGEQLIAVYTGRADCKYDPIRMNVELPSKEYLNSDLVFEDVNSDGILDFKLTGPDKVELLYIGIKSAGRITFTKQTN